MLRLFAKKNPPTSATTPDLAGKRLVLSELQGLYADQFRSADALDAKLRQFLSSASLILTVVTTLQITTGVERIGWLYLTGLICVLLLYVLLIIVVLIGLQPMEYMTSVPTSWEEITQRFFGKTEDTSIELLISTYLYITSDNNEPLHRKTKMVRYASMLFVLIVITLFLMGVIAFSSTVRWPWESSPLPVAPPIP